MHSFCHEAAWTDLNLGGGGGGGGGYVGEIISKKLCTYSECESFEHLLFLLDLIMSRSHA